MQFYNESIKYQLPILIGVVIIKYSILLYNTFQTHKSLFKANVYGYMVFVLVVLIIEYKDQIVELFTYSG